MSDTHAQTVSYVRDTMLPQQAPPVTERGALKWVRENLFSGWLNILLTVVSLYVVYLVLSLILPWAFGGVWNAGSLTECREVLFSVYKGSHDGACWAVIEDRWLQLLFGFYPPELYWRPILAFVLLLVALAPVLFSDKVPGQMIWFTLAFPFIATWLIWGGSFWTPIFAAFGFIAAVIAYKVLIRVAGPIVANLGALIAALVWWFVLMAPINDGLHKMIGFSRFDSTISRLEGDIETLPQEVARLEAQGEDVAAQIADAVAAKDATLAGMIEIRVEEVAVSAQISPKRTALQQLDGVAENLVSLSEALAVQDSEAASPLISDVTSDLEDALNDVASATADPSEVAELMVANAASVDPSILADVDAMVSKSALTGPIEDLLANVQEVSATSAVADIADLQAETGIVIAALQTNIASLETILEKVVATNAAPLAAPQAQFLKDMKVLADLRNDATAITIDSFRLSSELSDKTNFLSQVQSLAEREAEIPVLEARAAELGADLTRSQRNMISTNQLPDDTPQDVTAAVGAYLDVKNRALGLAASVTDTYSELGRIGLKPIDSRQIGGFMLAVIIGVAGIALSLPLGILLALGRQSHLFFINSVSVAFIEVIRGVPLIVWLFTASLLLNYFLPPGSNFDLMLRVIIMVTLFASAYIAEVIRGGLAALPTGQYEGADSLGLSYWQSMQLIILPQAMKISIPGIVNTFIGLFKDTVLVVFIGLLDPIGLTNTIRADTDWNGVYWELFIFVGLLFFIFCFSMGRYSLHLEKKLQREHR